jgi:hypothetical protein
MGSDETAASKEKPRSDPVDWVEDTAGAEMSSKDAAVDAAMRGQATTGYETLSLWETIKTFKVSTTVCFFAAFSAATDGYQIG